MGKQEDTLLLIEDSDSVQLDSSENAKGDEIEEEGFGNETAGASLAKTILKIILVSVVGFMIGYAIGGFVDKGVRKAYNLFQGPAHKSHEPNEMIITSTISKIESTTELLQLISQTIPTTPLQHLDPTPDSNRAIRNKNPDQVREAFEELKSFMDETVDPCEDFYMHSCGGWIKKNKPSTISSGTETSTFDQLDKSNTIAIRDILDSLDEYSTGAEKIARDFYISCLNKNIIDISHTTTAEPFTGDPFDNWNDDPDWLKNSDEYVDSGTEVNELGVYYDSDKDETEKRNSKIRNGPTYQNILIEQTPNRQEKSTTDIPIQISSQNSPTNTDNAVSLECASTTIRYLSPVTARLFVEKMFESKKEEIQYLVGAVESEYKHQISKAPWLDEKTRKYINGRLENLVKILGHPLRTMDRAEHDLTYGQLMIFNDSYTSNEEILRENYDDGFWSRLSNDNEDEYIIMANAFYNFLEDHVFIPAGLAQKPIYDPGYPDLINFARYAATVGHEMSHAFDEYIGNKNNEDNSIAVERWKENVSNSSLKHFQTKKSCVMEQYNAFELNLNSTRHVPVNGNSTFDENFADIAGLQVAFHAYMKVQRDEEGFESVSGLEGMTWEQLFFIAAAQSDCRAFPNDEVKANVLLDQIQMDSHSPSRIRVLGEMVNFHEFAKAFKCSKGVRYNPPHRCPIFT